MSKVKILPPVIVIGMHRSGTTMIMRMLEELGLFVGKRLEDNHEAIFFLELNDWMLHQCGGNWFHPGHISHLIENDKMRKLTVDYLCNLLKGVQVAGYTGVINFLGGMRPLQMTVPWGWKDPRNTFTLPVWLDIFPDARIIHIYRNGIDVARSLQVRAERELKEGIRLHEKRKRLALYRLTRKKGGFTKSLGCLFMEEGFSLWEVYVSKAFEHLARLKNASVTIKYEDFVKEPERFLRELSVFCGLNPEPSLISSVAKNIKEERGSAYLKDKELLEFYESKRNTDWMKKLGYVK